jgi:hypothetical protein
MHNPTCDMPALSIMVGPMGDAAYFIPDILTIKANVIPTFSPAMRGATSMLCVISNVFPDAS